MLLFLSHFYSVVIFFRLHARSSLFLPLPLPFSLSPSTGEAVPPNSLADLPPAPKTEAGRWGRTKAWRRFVSSLLRVARRKPDAWSCVIPCCGTWHTGRLLRGLELGEGGTGGRERGHDRPVAADVKKHGFVRRRGLRHAVSWCSLFNGRLHLLLLLIPYLWRCNVR